MRRLCPAALWLAAVLILTACNLPGQDPDRGSSLVSLVIGPRSWIDAPLHNSSHPLGPVEIIAHGSDVEGISELALSVNGEDLSHISPDDAAAVLVTIRETWTPSSPGTYLLQVRARSAAGVWGARASASVTIAAEIPELPEIGDTPTTPVPPITGPEACSPGAPTLVQPAGGATVGNPVALHWSYSGDCAPGGYLVEVAQDAGFGTLLVQQMADAGVFSYTISDLALCTTYFWRVAALDAGGGAVYSTIQQFSSQCLRATLTIDLQAPSVSVAFDPAYPADYQKVLFTATASDDVGVTRIEIYVIPQGSSGVPPVHTCENTTECLYEGGPFSPGAYSVSASAYDASGKKGNAWPSQMVVVAAPR